MDLKRNLVRKIVRKSISYPDELGIVACSPNAISGNECPVGELFKPIIPSTVEKQNKNVRDAVEELRKGDKELDYSSRFVNEDKCSLGPEIQSIVQEMKRMSPREIAELVPRISPRIEKLSSAEQDKFVNDIEKIITEDDKRSRSVAIFNLLYIGILTILLLVVLYSKKEEYESYLATKALPGLTNYWVFASVNILLGFSLFYFHYRYSFRITDMKTFQISSIMHIASLLFFYMFLRNGERNYSTLAFVSLLVVVLFQSSMLLNFEDVPGLNRLLVHYPSLYEKCATVQTTLKEKQSYGFSWTDILVSLLTNLLPALYLAIQYIKI